MWCAQSRITCLSFALLAIAGGTAEDRPLKIPGNAWMKDYLDREKADSSAISCSLSLARCWSEQCGTTNNKHTARAVAYFLGFVRVD